MFRKAQAAMEFLMTYGWAILVVLVVIGALAYFGVLSPSTLLPEKCTFPVSVNCIDYQVAADSIKLIMLNGAGRDMLIKNISASSEALGTGSLGVGCSNAAGSSIPGNGVLKNGEKELFVISVPDAVTACNFKDTGRDKNRYNLTVYYSWLDSPGVTHTMSGELLAKLSSTCHTVPSWTGDGYCTDTCKCEKGEGDCDSDSQCTTGYCRETDTDGARYRQSPGIDTCQ